MEDNIMGRNSDIHKEWAKEINPVIKKKEPMELEKMSNEELLDQFDIAVWEERLSKPELKAEILRRMNYNGSTSYLPYIDNP